MSKLKGKVAVVTGASKGIGAGIAKALAADGASVVVNYASSKEGADKVVKAITDKGGKAVAVAGDVSKPAGAKGIIDAAIKNFGQLDILVNNSGVYEFNPLEDVTEENFHRLFNVNVLGLLLTTKEAAKHLKEGGSIINIGSAVTEIFPPSSSVYTATKGAVDAITGVLARELGPRKIRVFVESRHGGNRGHPHRRLHRLGLRKAARLPGPARPHRPARRHRHRRNLPGLERFRLANRRNPGSLRRYPLTTSASLLHAKKPHAARSTFRATRGFLICGSNSAASAGSF